MQSAGWWFCEFCCSSGGVYANEQNALWALCDGDRIVLRGGAPVSSFFQRHICF